jgi:hypothetical protein
VRQQEVVSHTRYIIFQQSRAVLTRSLDPEILDREKYPSSGPFLKYLKVNQASIIRLIKWSGSEKRLIDWHEKHLSAADTP